MEENKDEILYHYTSQKGLLGIVNDGGIWASHIAYLNDSTEYNYTVNLFKKEINEHFQSKDTENNTYGIGRNIKPTKDNIKKNFFDDYIKIIQSLDSPNPDICVFVCSFSEKKDSLSQWRAYCHNSNGFSLGFKKSDLKKLKRIEKNNVFPLDFVKCEYDINIQKSMIKQVIDKYIGKVETEIEKHNSDFSKIGSSFIIEFLQLAPKLKDEAFKEEEEWRIFSILATDQDGYFNFRKGKSMLIPYIHINFVEKGGCIPIEEIIIGPTPYGELSKSSIFALLKSKGIRNTKIDISKVPYRAW